MTPVHDRLRKDELARAAGLHQLNEEIKDCESCRLSRSRIQAVPGESQVSARILLIGESPGATEDRLGRNFCGPSGRFLDDCLARVQMSRMDVNVSPILHCHPPRNRNPLPDEVEACLPFLHRRIDLLDPALLVVMGGVAARWFLGESSIGRIAGTWREVQGRLTLMTFHPAAGMRFPVRRDAMRQHFAELSLKARELGLL
jgi:uracil-DNA glycosylase